MRLRYGEGNFSGSSEKKELPFFIELDCIKFLRGQLDVIQRSLDRTPQSALAGGWNDSI